MFLILPALAAVCAAQSGPVSPALTEAIRNHQYDLADRGRTFLLEEGRKADYFLLGELHGDDEIPQLLRQLWPDLWKTGYRHVAAEVSPWAANQLEALPRPGAPAVEGLWTLRQARDIDAPAPQGVRVLWGCDMEEFHPEYLIRDLARRYPRNSSLRKMVSMSSSGYQRSMAEPLLGLLASVPKALDARVNGISLRDSLSATLQIDEHRLHPSDRMSAQNQRELLMKTQLVEHLRKERSGSKILLRFGRNHLHRGYDARGISTLGNFIAEYAIARGQSIFNVGVFGAGGQASLMGETFSADERGDEAAFALLAQEAHSAATLFDLRPLRPMLHSIPADKRSAAEVNLLYWADSYDALICYRAVTPLRE